MYLCLLNVSHLRAGRNHFAGNRDAWRFGRRVLLDAGVRAHASGGGRPACVCDRHADAGLAPAPSSLFPLTDKAKS